MAKKLMTPCIFYVGILMLTMWVIGFGCFCLYALSLRFQPAEQTDAIVVLTGGGYRVQTALDLLKEKYADNLLISGVHKTVKKEDLTGSLSKELAQNITLGYRAKNTKGNAWETADWIKGKDIHSVLLVTSFYHMPRSIFEFLKVSPQLKIIPLPVFPKSFGDSVDWIRTRYAWLLFVEYHKFIVVRILSFFER